MSENGQAMPTIVSADEWRRALDEFTVQEKAITRQLDTLNAQRRRLPMEQVDSDYRFTGSDGEATLLDLFDGRRQLIVYHFMFHPEWDEGCPGCSWLADAMTHPAHLHARDTSIVMVSRAELDKLHAYRTRMGLDLPWVSSSGSDFNTDMGAIVDGGDHHGVSVFLRNGGDVFRTYYSGARGVEHLGSHWTYLDLTPFGRQETWEDSPNGWPQAEPYAWFRHDDYPSLSAKT
jgi:predicted dithiol-disulfide oxidoreductase (DUF899 family)